MTKKDLLLMICDRKKKHRYKKVCEDGVIATVIVPEKPTTRVSYSKQSQGGLFPQAARIKK